MRVLKAILVAAAAAATFGVAAPAIAQPSNSGEVYTAQTGEGQYAVIYRGDRRMNRREVAEAAMLRAAQLTLEQGAQWFMVTSTSSQRLDLSTAAPLNPNTQGDLTTTAGGGVGGGEGAGNAGNAATAGVDPGAVGVGTGVDSSVLAAASNNRRPRMAYQTILMIRTGSGREVAVDDPNADVEIFDAASVVASMSGN